MLTYKYIARDPASGQKVKSEVQAENEQSAAKLIAKEGLSPIEVTLVSSGNQGFSKLLHRIKAKDKVLFSRQLSTLINAGLPLVQSLRNVQRQTTNKSLQAVISKVISDVEAGSAFSASLARHPDVFDAVFISLVAAGEASGTLDSSLERIANQQEKDAEIISKVRGAMVYPLIVMMVMIGVVGFMIIKVLPQVESIYKGIQGANLPLLTRALLAVSHFTIRFWWLVIIALVIMAFFTTRWARTFGGKQVIDKIKMKAWPVGPLFMKLYMARFARTGTTLVGSGVPLIQVLDITAKAVNNVHVAASLARATDKVRGGRALSEALKNDPNFLELVPNMLKIGEDSGSIEQMLEKTADYYEKEVDTQIKTISTIVEPVMMVVLGVVALIIVAAVLLPIYGLVGQGLIK
jgi:type IV pilus assembly protein PilC